MASAKAVPARVGREGGPGLGNLGPAEPGGQEMSESWRSASPSHPSHLTTAKCKRMAGLVVQLGAVVCVQTANKIKQRRSPLLRLPTAEDGFVLQNEDGRDQGTLNSGWIDHVASHVTNQPATSFPDVIVLL